MLKNLLVQKRIYSMLAMDALHSGQKMQYHLAGSLMLKLQMPRSKHIFLEYLQLQLRTSRRLKDASQ